MRRAHALLLVPAVVVGGMLAGCGDSHSTKPAPNRDPQKGFVKVWSKDGENLDNPTYKRCDGTTLVYLVYRGIAVIPNSPECTAK